MIFESNIEAIGKKNIILNKDLLLSKYKACQNCISIEISKSGQPTVKVVSGDKGVYLHSKYDPIKEAEIFINKYDAEDYRHVLFFGIGLGYHVEAFVQKHPNKRIYIYESKAEILATYLSNKIINESVNKSLENIYVPELNDNIADNLTELFEGIDRKVLIIVLPSIENAFAEDYKDFYRKYGRYFDSSNISKKTRQMFEKTWLTNVIYNFSATVESPNILFEGKKYFEGKPAVLVSAGPSLDEEIENLKYIKNNKLAYIFTAGSSINTLVENNIIPDAVISIDPSEHNHLVLKKLVDSGEIKAPLIFGTTIGYSTLNSYAGPKLHFITNVDNIAPFYLKYQGNKDIEITDGGGSVAIVGLDLMNRLGFDPLILVGQNLAYKSDKYYAKGIDYTVYGLADKNAERYKHSFAVPNVCGQDVYTNAELNRFREDFEDLITKNNIKNVINTTNGGAHIAGTQYKTLEFVINNYLKIGEIDDRVWSKFGQKIYDKEHLANQKKVMEAALQKYLVDSDKLYSLLDNITTAYNKGNEIQVREIFSGLQNKFSDIISNDFFKVFIYAANLCQCRLLVKALKEVNEQDKLHDNIVTISSEISAFMDKCNKDIDMISNLYSTLNEVIMKV